MKKMVTVTTILVLVFSLLMVACSNNVKEEENKGNVTPTPDAGTVETVDPAKEVKIRVAYYADDTARPTMEKIINNFMEQNKNIKVEITATDWDTHYGNLKVDLAADQGPTVFLLDGPYVPQYAQEKAILDLTDQLKEVNIDDFYGFDAIKSPEGRIYAVPQAIQVNVLYYNKDMFDKAQVAYPDDNWTTDNVYDAAVKLTDKSNKIYGIGLPQHIRYGWYTVVRQFGGDLLDKDRKVSTFASDPKVKEAFEYMKKFWDEGLTPNLKDQEGEIGAKFHTWMSRNIVAMFYDNYSRRLTNDKEGLNYDTALVPKGVNGGEHYSAFVANTWAINARASQDEINAGWAFVKYFLGEDAQKLNASLAEGITANKKVAQDVIANHQGNPEHVAVFLDSMQYAGDLGDSPVWEEWMGAVNPTIQDYLSGKITIDKMLVDADKAAQTVLDKK